MKETEETRTVLDLDFKYLKILLKTMNFFDLRHSVSILAVTILNQIDALMRMLASRMHHYLYRHRGYHLLTCRRLIIELLAQFNR